MQNPIRGLLHGAGAFASAVGLVVLLYNSTPSMLFAATVYGIALVSMFATSALYHSVPWSTGWKVRLQMLDHTFIYVLVAATCTPLLVAALDGGWLVAGLLGIWGLAGLGLAQEISKRRARRLVFVSQLVVGAVAVAAVGRTLRGVDSAAMILIIAGGVSYLLGTLLFVNNRPRLAPGFFSHHEFFHVMVIVASALHFLAVWRVVV